MVKDSLYSQLIYFVSCSIYLCFMQVFFVLQDSSSCVQVMVMANLFQSASSALLSCFVWFLLLKTFNSVFSFIVIHCYHFHMLFGSKIFEGYFQFHCYTLFYIAIMYVLYVFCNDVFSFLDNKE